MASCVSLDFFVTARKRSLEQGNIFALSVILFTGGEYLSMYPPVGPPRDQRQVHSLGPEAGTPPQDQRQVPPSRYTPGTRGRYTPPGPETGTPPQGQRQVHLQGPEAGTPPWDQRQVHPPAGTPPTGTSPQQVHSPAGTPPWQVHPQCSACWEIRVTSGRYASYWNAILFLVSDCL